MGWCKPTIEMIDRDYWYIVGFGLGDGCISKCGYSFRLLSTDKQVVEDISRVTGLSMKINNRSKQKSYYKDCYVVDITRKLFVEQLLSVGFPKNKSHTDGWLVIPSEGFEADFLRGFMDTDGCVTSSRARKTLASSFSSSSRLMLEWIKEFLEEKFGCGGSIRRLSSIWVLEYCKWDTHQIVNYLYNKEGIVNNRKRDKALRLCEELPIRRGSSRYSSRRSSTAVEKEILCQVG